MLLVHVILSFICKQTSIYKFCKDKKNYQTDGLAMTVQYFGQLDVLFRDQHARF